MTNEIVRVLIESPIPQAGLSLRDFIPSAIAALIGAFTGAGAAWWLQEKLTRAQEQRERANAQQREIDVRFAAANKALFALFCQTNDVFDLQKTIVDHKKDAKPHLSLPVMPFRFLSTPRVDLDSLTFLLETRFCPNVLRDLYFAQGSFEFLVEVLGSRNRLRNEITKESLANAVSPLTEKQLQEFTATLFTSVDECLQKLEAIKPRLFDCLKKIDQGRPPMDFVIIKGPQNQRVESTENP